MHSRCSHFVALRGDLPQRDGVPEEHASIAANLPRQLSNFFNHVTLVVLPDFDGPLAVGEGLVTVGPLCP